MEIISIYYALFSIVTCFLFYVLNHKYRVIFLSLISCGFIASLSLNLLSYVLLFTIVNYLIGLKIPGSHSRKTLFRTGITVNLLQIFILKYADFTLNPVFHFFDLNLNITRLSDIIVPVGISYFTLQGIGYIVNVYMGWERPEKAFFSFLLYISFYPKFLSGPVERSNHFLPQLKTVQTFSVENVIQGLRIALLGFFKKVIIANHLATYINNVYSNPDAFGGLYIWIVIFVQPLYLYFDFSGYTDIAIGFARTCGINLLPNFNFPFLSENVTTFWKRFHVSLSSWFNDFVFKQASFRFRKLKTQASILAVFITWILFGIWHGAGWNFMALGFIQALAINYEYFTKKQRIIFFAKLPVFLKIWTGRLLTYSFFGWALTFFFSTDLTSTLRLFCRLKSSYTDSPGNIFSEPLLFGLSFALLFIIFEILQNDFKILYLRLQKFWNDYRFIRIIIYYAAAMLIISQLSGNVSFVYQMF